MQKLTIEFFTLDEIIKDLGQYGLDDIYKIAKETIEKGGRVEITMEYENAPKDVLRVLSTLDEVKEFFHQV